MNKKGYVYILSNPSMPGILKIGRSKHGGKARASQLNGTGVPTPFSVEFEILVPNSEDVENLSHEKLDKHRVSGRREFFRIDLSEAIYSIIDSFVSECFDDKVISCDEYYSLLEDHEKVWMNVV